jgi:hypothetical protein
VENELIKSTTYVISKNLRIVNNCPIGENSPTLVTLLPTTVLLKLLFFKNDIRESKLFLTVPNCFVPKIYISRAMSGWGDRLWAFGAGLFMNQLAPQNLRLVAINGFSMR